MKLSTRLLLLFFLAIIFVVSGCATSEYRNMKDLARSLELQGDIEEAYQYYKKLEETKPGNSKLQVKINELAQIICDEYTKKGVSFFNKKKYKTALNNLNKAVSYFDNSMAQEYIARADANMKAINERYSLAEKHIIENEWEMAVRELTVISEIYMDDPEIDKKIEDIREQGCGYFISASVDARNMGHYKTSYEHLKAANDLKTSDELDAKIKIAKKYIEADKLYLKARNYYISDSFQSVVTNQKDNNEYYTQWLMRKKFFLGNDEYGDVGSDSNVFDSMNGLLKTRTIVPDHYRAEYLIQELLPVWSHTSYEYAEKYFNSKEYERSFELINVLYQLNPSYKETVKLYEKTRNIYLKNKYNELVKLLSINDIQNSIKKSKQILKADSTFLDTLDLMSALPIKACNLFYQKGCQYVDTSNYGKAVLCFKSAEQQLSENELFSSNIKSALDNIKKVSALNIMLWDFSQEIDDPSIGNYSEEKLSDLIKSYLKDNKFKNITFNFDNIYKDTMLGTSIFSNEIDWTKVNLNRCNVAITGNIHMLKLDKSMTSEWETDQRKVVKFVDNEEYSKAVVRRAELNRGLDGKEELQVDNEKYLKYEARKEKILNEIESLIPDSSDEANLRKKLIDVESKMQSLTATRKMKKSEIKDELEEIEDMLPGIPPKIMAEVLDEVSFQIVTHTLTAHIQLAVSINSPDGANIWPVMQYNETYTMEDNVIPPDLNSEDPEARKGDPLELPSDSDFKKQAIAEILAQKVVPDMINNLNEYGTEFYLKAEALNNENIQGKVRSVSFLDSIEEYYKFLACYEDKGEDDSITEKVQQKLDEYINDRWLFE